MPLTHGGNLIQASAEFGIPLAEWIDLSTGISPWSWPVPPVPESVWQRLPEDNDGLLDSAAAYYGCATDELLAVPGSQYAIARLPTLVPPGVVALPHWGYREHQRAWELAGHRPVIYRNAAELSRLIEDGEVTNALVINPNNPSGELIDPALLTEMARALNGESGHLVVDEAFMDPHPRHSLIPDRPDNAVVLHSLGKFFGLAGVRLGFAVAAPALLARLAATLDPWAVSHPARWIGRQALADKGWHEHQRQRLENRSRDWLHHLHALFPALPWRHSPLFTSAETALAPVLYRVAARRGLLLRLHDDREPGLIRLGLPADRQRDRALAILDDIRRAL